MECAAPLHLKVFLGLRINRCLHARVLNHTTVATHVLYDPLQFLTAVYSIYILHTLWYFLSKETLNNLNYGSTLQLISSGKFEQMYSFLLPPKTMNIKDNPVEATVVFLKFPEACVRYKKATKQNQCVIIISVVLFIACRTLLGFLVQNDWCQKNIRFDQQSVTK